ncbi:UNVERIFIED_CONTAM: hypothetical protein K2H54_041268 [Gekko kuhli]
MPVSLAEESADGRAQQRRKKRGGELREVIREKWDEQPQKDGVIKGEASPSCLSWVWPLHPLCGNHAEAVSASHAPMLQALGAGVPFSIAPLFLVSSRASSTAAGASLGPSSFLGRGWGTAWQLHRSSAPTPLPSCSSRAMVLPLEDSVPSSADGG